MAIPMLSLPLRKVYLLFLFPFLFLPQSVLAQDNEIDTGVAEALRCIKMTPRDLCFRNDYLERDPFRLEVVDHLMKNPLEMIPYSRKLSLSLQESSDAASLLRIAAREISIVDATQWEIVDTISECWSGGDPEKVAAILFRQQPKERFWKRRHKEFIRDLKGLPPRLREGLVTFLDGINLLHLASKLTFEALSEAEYDSLRYGMALLLSEDEFDEFKTVEELDSLEKLGEQWAENIIHLAAKTKVSSTFSYAFAGIEKIGEATEQFRKLAPEEFEKAKEKDGFLFRALTPLGIVAIGDGASQNYAGEFLLVVDLGGG